MRGKVTGETMSQPPQTVDLLLLLPVGVLSIVADDDDVEVQNI